MTKETLTPINTTDDITPEMRRPINETPRMPGMSPEVEAPADIVRAKRRAMLGAQQTTDTSVLRPRPRTRLLGRQVARRGLLG